MIESPDPREPELVTESPYSTFVEFSDADHPWTTVPKEERDAILRLIRSPRRPQPPADPKPPAE